MNICFSKKINILFLALFLLSIKTSHITLASSVPISMQELKDENILSQIEEDALKKKKNNISYITKQEDIKQIANKNYPQVQAAAKVEASNISQELYNQNQPIYVNSTQIADKILFQSERKINAIYPRDNYLAPNGIVGYRGANQLVIYAKDFGRTTNTNEFGKEAVVVDGIVVRLTGANSNIPRNGFVISGHGTAKKWIGDNLKIGTKVELMGDTIKAYTTIDSYRFYAKHKIETVENVLISTKLDYINRDDKYVYYYLKKAKQQYKKSLKDASDTSLQCAKEAIENATMAYRYTLPFLNGELKGVWIRPTQKNIQEVQQTLDLVKDTGITNIFIETYYHGKTIFPSKVMQSYGFDTQNQEFNYDVLAAFIREAHKRGIKVHVWFESFYIGNKNPLSNSKSILALHPNWQNKTRQKADYEGFVSHPQEHNGYFLDPANPEVTTFLLKLIAEISARYNIDGFNIDYVRYPSITKENYTNQWGYTQYARNEFQIAYGMDPMDIEPRSSMWDNWCEYRQDKITNYIQKVSELVKNRNIMFSAVIFPDYKTSLQVKFQDWARWADRKYIDAFTPLILTSDEELAKTMLEEIKRKAGSNVDVYPGLFSGFIESDPEDILKQIHILRKLRLGGVILFDWAHLNDNYREVLKTSVFKMQTY